MPQGFAIVNNQRILVMSPYGQLHIYAERRTAEYLLKDIQADGLPNASIIEVDVTPKAQQPKPDWMT